MAHINLLPWRESRRNKHKNNYLTLLVALALIAVGLMFAAGNVLDKLTENQNYRNNFLEQHTILLDQQIEKIKNIKKNKQAIEQRMALIEQLEASRNAAPIVLMSWFGWYPMAYPFAAFLVREILLKYWGSVNQTIGWQISCVNYKIQLYLVAVNYLQSQRIHQH